MNISKKKLNFLIRKSIRENFNPQSDYETGIDSETGMQNDPGWELCSNGTVDQVKTRLFRLKMGNLVDIAYYYLNAVNPSGFPNKVDVSNQIFGAGAPFAPIGEKQSVESFININVKEILDDLEKESKSKFPVTWLSKSKDQEGVNIKTYTIFAELRV